MSKGGQIISTIVLIFGLPIFICSCDKEESKILDGNGVVIKLPHTWKTSITDNELAQVAIATPIIYDEDNLIVGSNRNSNRVILSLKASNGSINWEWSDLLGQMNNPAQKDAFTIFTESYHHFNNLLFFTYSTNSYCIDLTTGESKWKYQSFRSRFSRNAGLDNTYFTSGANYDPIDEEKIYFGDILSSDEEKLLLTPEYTTVQNPPVNAQGTVTYLTPFKTNGNTLLAFGISNPSKDFTIEGLGLSELNLYNIDQEKYEYKKLVVNSNRETFGITHLTFKEPNLYFQSSNYIHCHDALSGNELWRTNTGPAPLLSSMILVDNKLYSACEDRFLYCIDATTGNVLWKEQNTGTCSELSYLNGVLYYLGGGDGLLHAVDADTGKHLWKISSPDLGGNSDAWFYGVCTAVPGKDGKKGVVVATTGLHAYGYEAAR